jgi:hypothetical protein
MELSSEEAAEYAGGALAQPGDAPKYPWGLCLELNDEALAKLGIAAEQLPAVGTTMLLQAHVRVVSMSQNQQLDGDKEGRISLQIEEMGLGAPDTTPPEEKLYGAD